MVLLDGRARALFSNFYCETFQAYRNIGGRKYAMNTQ